MQPGGAICRLRLSQLSCQVPIMGHGKANLSQNPSKPSSRPKPFRARTSPMRPKPCRRSRSSTTATPRSCAIPSPRSPQAPTITRATAPSIPRSASRPRPTRRSTRALAYGHMPTPGHYLDDDHPARICSRATSIEQLRLIIRNHGVPVTVSESTTPIPLHFAFLEGTHVDGVGGRPHQAAAARPVRRARPRRHRRPHRQRHLRGRSPASRCRWRRSPRSASTIRCTGCRTTRRPARTISRISCCSPTTSSTSTSSASMRAS